MDDWTRTAMKNQLTFLAVAVFAVLGAGYPPALAFDNESLNARWTLWPDTTRVHPKKQKLAMVAQGSMDVVSCHLS